MDDKRCYQSMLKGLDNRFSGRPPFVEHKAATATDKEIRYLHEFTGSKDGQIARGARDILTSIPLEKRLAVIAAAEDQPTRDAGIQGEINAIDDNCYPEEDIDRIIAVVKQIDPSLIKIVRQIVDGSKSIKGMGTSCKAPMQELRSLLAT